MDGGQRRTFELITMEKSEKEPDKGLQNSWKEYFQLGEVFGYFFRKKDDSRPHNFNIKVMHGINKISIIIFILGVIFIILRRIFFY